MFHSTFSRILRNSSTDEGNLVMCSTKAYKHTTYNIEIVA